MRAETKVSRIPKTSNIGIIRDCRMYTANMPQEIKRRICTNQNEEDKQHSTEMDKRPEQLLHRRRNVNGL